MHVALQPGRLEVHHKLPRQRLDRTALRSRLAHHELVSRHRNAQRAERSSRAPELPFQSLHHAAKPLRRNPLRSQAPQRLHRYQIAEIEKSLAPPRARLQKPQAGPILELLPCSAGHALHFTARELLLHSPVPGCRPAYFSPLTPTHGVIPRSRFWTEGSAFPSSVAPRWIERSLPRSAASAPGRCLDFAQE